MNILGVIAEFNPFHNGHKYLLETAKKQCQADYTIVVMSGNFTQRGEPAIYDKFIRTRWALMCGADLVIELPVVSATASAGDFALGGVAQLFSSGVVTHLAFGCENPDLSKLMRMAEIFGKEPEGYKKHLKAGLKAGLAWPDARSRAMIRYTSDEDIAGQAYANLAGQADADFARQEDADSARHTDTASMLRQSNNILALEYLMALHRLGAHITPVPVARIHSGYHDITLDTPICSATALRLAITGQKAPEDYLGHFPGEIAKNARQTCLDTPPITADDFSSMLAWRLHHLTGSAPGDTKLTDISDVDRFLADRITNQLNTFTGFSDFADQLKHRSYTRTRISRALLHVILDITRQDSQAFTELGGCGYLRILGFRQTAAPLLSEIKKQAAVPMITRPQHYAKLLEDSRARRLFALDVSSSDIYRLAWNIKAKQAADHEFLRPLIRI